MKNLPPASSESLNDTSRDQQLFDLTGVLVFPNSGEVAFASLGFLKVLNIYKQSLRFADFSYLPTPSDSSTISPKKSLLIGKESGHTVREFDLIGFSISYENDYINVIKMLLSAGIPPLAKDRHDVFPVVIFGGFTMFMNPTPLSPFADAIVVGEAEPVLEKIFQRLEKAKAAPRSKPKLLEDLSTIEGVYVPALGRQTVRRVWTPVEEFTPESVSAQSSHFRSMLLVEVGRGCGRKCKFCVAGRLYRPVRYRSMDEIVSRSRGSPRIGLVGTSVGDHPQILDILEALVQRGNQVGISSLRVDQVNSRLVDLLVKGGVRSLAVAPETGSDTLRDRIGKGITREQIIECMELLGGRIPNIKLYFMIGLPDETDADVGEIVSLVEILSSKRSTSSLVVSVSPFVPKPHTGMERERFESQEVLRRRIRILRAISSLPGCTLKVASTANAWMEALLARADEETGYLLLEAARADAPLRTFLKRRVPHPPEEALSEKEALPWDFIRSR